MIRLYILLTYVKMLTISYNKTHISASRFIEILIVDVAILPFFCVILSFIYTARFSNTPYICHEIFIIEIYTMILNRHFGKILLTPNPEKNTSTLTFDFLVKKKKKQLSLCSLLVTLLFFFPVSKPWNPPLLFLLLPSPKLITFCYELITFSMPPF